MDEGGLSSFRETAGIMSKKGAGKSSRAVLRKELDRYSFRKSLQNALKVRNWGNISDMSNISSHLEYCYCPLDSTVISWSQLSQYCQVSCAEWRAGIDISNANITTENKTTGKNREPTPWKVASMTAHTDQRRYETKWAKRRLRNPTRKREKRAQREVKRCSSVLFSNRGFPGQWSCETRDEGKIMKQLLRCGLQESSASSKTDASVSQRFNVRGQTMFEQYHRPAKGPSDSVLLRFCSCWEEVFSFLSFFF